MFSLRIFLFTLIILLGPGIYAKRSALFAPKIDAQKIEKLIWLKCNQERKKYRLPPYRYQASLAQVARYHSANMASHHFFSHTDHRGRSPQRRTALLYPHILGGIGENIALNHGRSEEEIAENLVVSWMHSPGHRANILSRDYSYVGNGVVLDPKRSKVRLNHYYATQVFGELLAEFLGELPLRPTYGSKLTLAFKFLGHFSREQLYIYITYPDKNYKHHTSSRSYYTGGGPYQPQWKKDGVFTVTLTLDKGWGTYHLKMGRNGSFYSQGLVIEVTE